MGSYHRHGLAVYGDFEREVEVTEYYKGQRISELLAMINSLQKALDENRDDAKGEDVFRIVESESTLAIMKAKLTALQGEK